MLVDNMLQDTPLKSGHHF